MPTVTIQSPADNATNVDCGAPVRIRVQRTDSLSLNITKTTKDDFSQGDLSDVIATDANALTLRAGRNDQLYDGFEGYSTGSLPSTWWEYSGGSTATVETLSGNKTLKVANSAGSSEPMILRKYITPIEGYEIEVTIYMTDQTQEIAGLVYDCQEARAYANRWVWIAYLNVQTQQLVLAYREAGNWNSVNTYGMSLSPGKYYRLKVKRDYLHHQIKAWEIGTAEPTSWQIDRWHETITHGGSAGVWTAAYVEAYFDDFVIRYHAKHHLDFSNAPHNALPMEWTPLIGTFDTNRWKVEWGGWNGTYWWGEWARLVQPSVGIEDRLIYHEGTGKKADVDLTIQWALWDTSSEPCFMFRLRNSAPVHGYCVKWNRPLSKIQLTKVIEGSETVVAEVSGGAYGTGNWRNFRVQAIGSAIKVKEWSDTGTEPSSWLIEATDSSISAAGYLGLRHYDGYEGPRVRAIMVNGGYNTACLWLDGSDDKVDFGNASVLKPTGAVSVEAWVRKDTQTGNRVLVGWDASQGYAVWWNGQTLYFGLNLSSWTTTPGYTFTDDEWHHIAYTWDGSTIRFYLDGSEIVGQQQSASGTITYAGNLTLGNNSGSATVWWAGRVAELRVWSDQRTGTEINSYYTKRINPASSNLVGYWYLDARNRQEFPDKTTGGSNGTSSGTPLLDIRVLGPYTVDLDYESPAVYHTPGTWISPSYSLAAASVFGYGTIEWDSTLPSGTSISVYTNVTGGSGWQSVTNGARIPELDEGDSLTSSVIQVKAVLSTTSTDVTPALNEVRIKLRSQGPSLVELVVNGITHTVANGGLTYWGYLGISGSAMVEDFRDVYYETAVPYVGLNNGKVITVEAYYDDTLETSSDFTTSFTERAMSSLVGFYAITPPAYATADAFFIPVLIDTAGFIRGDVYFFVQPPLYSSGDVHYIVGFPLRFYVPSSAVAGGRVDHLVPASAVVDGYQRTFTPASAIVQGWTLGFSPASGVAAVKIAPVLAAASAIAASEIRQHVPASAVGYYLEARTIIEINVVDADTLTAYEGLGIMVFETEEEIDVSDTLDVGVTDVGVKS